jgi:hypothetical protein
MLMARRWWMTGVAGTVSALVLSATGVAADLNPAGLTLQASDVPGGTLRSKGPVKERNYVSAYQRSFTYATPFGRSRMVYVQSEAMVSTGAAKAAKDLVQLRTALTLKAGRTAFIATVAKNLHVAGTSVKLGALHAPKVGDHAVELPVSVDGKGGRIYESVLYVQLDRVVNVFISAGLRPIAAVDTNRYASAAIAHIAAALAPSSLVPPTVSGTPTEAETLKATSGTWSVGRATFTYQWQRCDTTGASCTDVAGATGQSYVLAAGDVGMTLRVKVTGRNRFGTAAAVSATTAVVSAAPPPG